MFNVVNPDDIIEQFGADTLRLYEMFLGPLEAHKPWDTQGIDGVYKFLRKFWRLFLNGEEFSVSDEVPTKEELKVLQKNRIRYRKFFFQYFYSGFYDLYQRIGCTEMQ